MRRVGLIMLAVGAVFAPAASLALAADPLAPQQWNMDLVEASAARAVTDGTGAVVAVIDTGVQADHPDLAGRLLPGHDFVDKDDTPQDGDGHGTHVTGIVAAVADNGVGVAGLAPGTKILPVRVLGNDGSGTDEDVARGIDYAIEQKADIINLSLGGALLLGDSEVFDAAVKRALDAGIIVAAASGNDGVPVCQQGNSDNPGLLCVGSVDRRGQRSAFSSFGVGLAITAPGGSAVDEPGENVLSTYKDSGYKEIAGTSQATPHVAAVAAMLVSRGIRGQAAVQRILATARDAGLPGPDSFYGAGIVNAKQAVAGLPGPGGGTGGSGGGGSGGTGGGATTPPVGQGSSVRVTVPRTARVATILRRGILVHCRAAGAGRCSATVSLAKRRVGAGSAPVQLGRLASVRVRLTKAGRTALAARRTSRLTVRVRVPGAALQTRTISVRR